MSFALRDRPLPGDETALPGIATACGNFSAEEVAFVPEILEKLIEEGELHSGYRLLVASDAQGPAAFAIWGPIPATDNRHDLYWIATHPRAQGKGAGRLLLTETARRARLENASHLFIETETGANYTAAHKLYEACGFPLIATIPDYYRDGRAKAVYGARL